MQHNIAILIPCYNEKLTIQKVIHDYRKVLPEADIYVMIIIQQTTQLKLPIMEEQLCDMSTDRVKVMLSELCFVTLKQIAI